ncbi:hypothetical protein [Moorena sp. SIO2C4]|uniref:hypothetical protein n=1 Tax=Moorena sp. SIO2C4 TaxID=2607824 RepID=UPI0013C21099|nr:hypothetical protein [Moorena sp. SIO2C4]NEQ14278.1 hypothetical protein [Moorena sp. SIO3E2]NES43031.1 hypothetical protein [Moorena sp. SIO2C4]
MLTFPDPLFPTPYSLLPTPYSLLPTPYSLLPTPYSLLPFYTNPMFTSQLTMLYLDHDSFPISLLFPEQYD